MHTWIDSWAQAHQALRESGLAGVMAQPPEAVVQALRLWLSGRTCE